VTPALQIPGAFRRLFEPSRYKAAWSGRGAAKSHSFAAALLTLGYMRQERILCCREIQTSIKDSVKRLLDDKIASMPHLAAHYRSTDQEIVGLNGTLFTFAGLRTNIDSVKSKEGYTRAWVEEAHSVSAGSLEILRPTMRADNSEIWLAWNPRFPTDPVDTMFRGSAGPPPDSILIPTNWRDNPFFPDVLRKELEWDKRRDPAKHQHVWEGGYRLNTEAAVFKNWRIGSPEEFKDEPERPYYGGDWGYSQDPTVCVRLYIEGRTLYIDYEAWEIGCEIDRTPALFDRVPGARLWPMTADSARPETISYMRRNGYPKIVAARKGKGSVEEGVEFIKNYDVVIHPRCVHAIQEFTLYSYEVDPQIGRVLPTLADKFNHVIDSVRYATEGSRRIVEWKMA
jgi:phage terminase large subunit